MDEPRYTRQEWEGILFERLRANMEPISRDLVAALNEEGTYAELLADIRRLMPDPDPKDEDVALLAR